MMNSEENLPRPDEDSWSDSCSVQQDSDHDKSEEADVDSDGRSGTPAYLSGSLSRRIRMVRFLILGIIAVVGAFLSALTYRILETSQTNDFRDAFHEHASTLSKSMTSAIFGKATGMEFLGQQITASAIEHGSTFPNVTVPMFEVFGKQAALLSGDELITYCPLVRENELKQWEAYSEENAGEVTDLLDRVDYPVPPGFSIFSYVFYSATGEKGAGVSRVPHGRGLYTPIWHAWPIPIFPIFNYDLRTKSNFEADLDTMLASRALVFSSFYYLGNDFDFIRTPKQHQYLHEGFLEDPSTDAQTIPHFTMMQPVFDRIVDPRIGDGNATITGVITSTNAFNTLFRNSLPEGTPPIIAVMKNDLGEAVTFRVEGNTPYYIDESEIFDNRYESMRSDVSLAQFYETIPEEMKVPRYSLSIYPTTALEESFRNSIPLIFGIIVAGTFVLMASIFLIYDLFVRRRNSVVTDAAVRSEAIVTSMFPSNFRDRLYEDAVNGKLNELSTTTKDLSSFLQSGEKDSQAHGKFSTSKPIADLFPETTIMFADLAGFTAWSSTREPTQVFVLLETIYRAFDEVASRRGVYKVETVGDCYVAVCGLPNPRKDHAVAMARFARDCIIQTDKVTRELEVELGPDTTDLGIRIGLHSGAVTAGVLRGERSRFQLFGDTMNTAARMEQTGMSGRIHLSPDTAALVRDAGKDSWLEARDQMIEVKGKGKMKTFWLSLNMRMSSRRHFSEADSVSVNNVIHDHRTETEKEDKLLSGLSSGKLGRLVSWNVDILARLLCRIEARRQLIPDKDLETENSTSIAKNTGDVLSEVTEIICLPENKISGVEISDKTKEILLPEKVLEELRNFVSSIAALYHHENPFHNFEHASHVTMSVVKLLSRIVAPCHLSEGVESLHDHTYGITSDPLTQFACIFSALIHDVDHPGVPNTQLIKEETSMAKFYKNRSVAEQNSVDLTWSLLMSDEFDHLREAICVTGTERLRFRQLVVNSVMATDIMDKDLKQLRNNRWDMAFSEKPKNEAISDTVNRKATIVIEHLIQASDVAHTMQHWHVYRKWNERLFLEMLEAFRAGRSTTHPVEGWYQGEIGFFDFYIIPLARKLKNCGVFGVSSDEYLLYAQRNRDEWEMRGQEIVAEMMEKFEKNTEEIKTSFSTPVLD